MTTGLWYLLGFGFVALGSLWLAIALGTSASREDALREGHRQATERISEALKDVYSAASDAHDTGVLFNFRVLAQGMTAIPAIVEGETLGRDQGHITDIIERAMYKEPADPFH